MLAQESSQRSYTLVESFVVGIYCLILVVAVLTQFFQAQFINIHVLGPILGCIGIGLFFHVLYLLNINRWAAKLWVHGFLFSLNALITTCLIYFSGLNQSMFFFIYLVNILAAGMIFQSQGSLLVALLSSFLFNFVMLIGPEVKAASFLFVLALNNLAFFAVASLSGYLSEQLNFMGGELARVGRSLRELKNFNELLLNQIPLGVLSVDRMGELMYANPRLAEKIGAEEFRVKELLRGLGANQSELQWSNGKILQINSDTLSVENEELGKIIVVNDVTEIRRLEEKMKTQERLAAVGQLAAGIAHEIRNPLASISGSVEMLSHQAESEDDKKLFSIVLKETQRLNNLITEFLDYARPSQLQLSSIDLVSLLREILEAVKMSSSLVNGVEIQVEMPEVCRINADRDKLKQAFLNLIINALQAMQGAPQKILSLKLETLAQGVKLGIRDTGSGMTPETKKRLFEPFYTTKAKGTGLGLAVTHKILDSHKCQIKVESELNQGTNFEILFLIN